MERWLRGSFLAMGVLTLLMAGCASKQVAKSTPAAGQPVDEKRMAEARVHGVLAQSGLDAIKKRGTLRILVDSFDPPFGAWRKAGDTKTKGFVVDVGERITEIIFGGKVQAAFSSGLEQTKGYNPLQSLEVDMQFTRRTIDLGEDQVRFSQPYYTDSVRLVVRRDQGVTGVKDLAGKLVSYSVWVDAITPDPTRSAQLKEAQATAGFKLQKFEGTEGAVYAVVERKVAAVLLPTSEAVGHIQARKNAGLVALPDRYESWSYGAIMRKENAELADAVDKAIRQMTESGELAQLTKKWGLDI